MLIKKIFFQLLCMVGGGLFLFTGCNPAEEPGRPNVILIITDDMGYSDIGCYGGEVQTPHIDKLAVLGQPLFDEDGNLLPPQPEPKVVPIKAGSDFFKKINYEDKIKF